MMKIKQSACRTASVLMAALILLFLLSAPAMAAEAAIGTDTVSIDENGTVTLLSGRLAGEKVASVQVRVTVEPAEGASVSFVFDGGLGGRLTNSSYRDGTLNIYIAGSVPLMAEGQDRLTLGVISGADLQSVQLPADALQFVYGRRVIAQTAEVMTASEAVPEETNPEPAPESDARSALQAALDSAAEQFGQDVSVKDRYTQESWDALQAAISAAYELLNSPDAADDVLAAALTALQDAINGLRFTGRTALETALEQARGYDPAGYTQDSFAALLAAIQNAESVLASTEAQEADWTDAVTQIQQAMEKLVPVSGADGNGPVIQDGPDSGTGPGSPEPGGQTDGGTVSPPVSEPTATPEPTATAEPTVTPEPTAAPEPTAGTGPSISPEFTGGTAPTAVPAAASPAPGPSAPNTGDSASVWPWIALLVLSGALLAALPLRQRAGRK